MPKRNSSDSGNAVASRPATSSPRIGGTAFELVDPAHNRDSNADESMPETLVADVVRMNLDERPGGDAEAAHRFERIAQRAYEIAQQRGFAPGAEIDDWLIAEREIDSAPIRQSAPEDQFTG